MAVALAVTAAGCSSDDQDSTPTTAAVVTTTAPAPSAACDGGGPTDAVERLDVTVDGAPRTALVHLPSKPVGADPPPVVLSFHGLSGSASLHRATDGLTDKADEEGFVAVHPEGLPVGLNDQVTGTMGWDPDSSDVDESAFVGALLDELGDQVCVDRSRVYATGFSAGAYNALTVACALPDRIAAVAAVSAAYQSTSCASDRSVPTLAFHGLDDLITPFDGRSTEDAGTFVPVLDALGAQAVRNGCTGGPDTEAVTATVQSLTWTGCAAPTVLYRLSDHGHAWPGHPLPFTADVLAQVLGGSAGQPPDPLMVAIGLTPAAMAQNVLLTNVEIDATDLIWDFFAARP